MPELPEIEALRRTLAHHALERPIASVDLRDPERLRGARPEDLEAALEGWHFTGAHRHGKILFLDVNCGWKLAVHLGMTGTLVLFDAPASEPAHARLVLAFEDGGRLAYTDMRRLGWVELTDDPAIYLRSQSVGPDALGLAESEFAERVGAKRGAIKSALMDQARVAGIGNVYADEILFQAGISPDHSVADLAPAALARLHARTQDVLSTAAERGGFDGHLPEDWLIHRRSPDGTCPHCATALRQATVGGRTSYACPACQA